MLRRNLFLSLLILIVVLISAGCSKPDPPKLTPKEARVVAVGPDGIQLLVKIEATNPNKITLSCQSVTAKAKLDGKWDLGTVTIAKPIVLPPNVPTMIDVPLTMPWTDVTALGSIAAANKPTVPYALDGTVSIGGERLNVDVPFHMEGTITREQITSAALKSIPSIPGLRLP